MAQLAPILLIEDSQDDSDLALRAFRHSRFKQRIVVVRNGVEALDFLYLRGTYTARATGLPLVILLDIVMPHMDGLSFLRAVKADKQLRGIPVVVLTAGAMNPNLGQCFALGVNGYLVKPIGPAGFLEVMTAIGLGGRLGLANTPTTTVALTDTDTSARPLSAFQQAGA